MTSLFGETSTVVGDNNNDRRADKDFLSKASVSPVRPNTKGKDKVDEFVATMDYTLEERRFFIRIGKDGVVGALEKLDEQLVQVSKRTQAVFIYNLGDLYVDYLLTKKKLRLDGIKFYQRNNPRIGLVKKLYQEEWG